MGADIVTRRNDIAKPLWETFRLWCLDEILNHDKNSQMHKALGYLIRHYDELTAYLNIPEMPLDNNAVESMFRHIAIGRRNWLNSGSHEAAQNIAFMYSLYESCKMNGLDFGEYVEDILTRMMNGDTDYMSMVPCNYTSEEKHESRAA